MPFYDYYDDMAPTKVGLSWARRQARYVYSLLNEHHPRAASLMEIGPGHGAFAELCSSQGLTYVAFDLNQRLLDSLNERGVQGVRGVAPQLPFADKRLDVTFASHVIEHSPNYQGALLLLEEMRRVVAPGGLVAVVAPDYLGLGADFWNCDYSHSFVTTRRRLLQIFRDAGLTVEHDEMLWGPLTGLAGRLTGTAISNRFTSLLARSTPGVYGERLYKARLTFARAILVIGRVTT